MRKHGAEVLNSPNGNSVKGVNGVHTLAYVAPLVHKAEAPCTALRRSGLTPKKWTHGIQNKVW